MSGTANHWCWWCEVGWSEASETCWHCGRTDGTKNARPTSFGVIEWRRLMLKQVSVA